MRKTGDGKLQSEATFRYKLLQVPKPNFLPKRAPFTAKFVPALCTCCSQIPGLNFSLFASHFWVLRPPAQRSNSSVAAGLAQQAKNHEKTPAPQSRLYSTCVAKVAVLEFRPYSYFLAASWACDGMPGLGPNYITWNDQMILIDGGTDE